MTHVKALPRSAARYPSTMRKQIRRLVILAGTKPECGVHFFGRGLAALNKNGEP
jgi:hypothetical protein